MVNRLKSTKLDHAKEAEEEDVVVEVLEGVEVGEDMEDVGVVEEDTEVVVVMVEDVTVDMVGAAAHTVFY